MVLALRFTVLQGVIGEIAGSLPGKVVEVGRLIAAAGFEPMKAGGIEQSGRLEVSGDLHDLVIGPAEARSLINGT